MNVLTHTAYVDGLRGNWWVGAEVADSYHYLYLWHDGQWHAGATSGTMSAFLEGHYQTRKEAREALDTWKRSQGPKARAGSRSKS